jgi:hypothetical protein
MAKSLKLFSNQVLGPKQMNENLEKLIKETNIEAWKNIP